MPVQHTLSLDIAPLQRPITYDDRILLIGEQPGRLIAQWTISQPHPRDEVDPRLTAIRVEIVQKLRATRSIRKT